MLFPISSLNFPDLLIVQGKYQMRPPLPFVPGAEFAGVVEAVGEGVKHLQVGSHVAGFAGTELAKSFGNAQGGLPYTVVITPDGAVTYRKMGRVNAEELRKLLDSVVPGTVQSVDPARNTLVLAGTEAQRKGAHDVIAQFDVNWLRAMSLDRKSTRLNSSHSQQSRMPSSA